MEKKNIINKAYVLENKKMVNDKCNYKYCTVSAGESDIASLIYRTMLGETGEIAFGMDGCYKARLIAGDTEVPKHYHLMFNTNASWIWIYDDNRRVLFLDNDAGFEIYEAGEMGLLIRFK
ncbi:hypothetical protein [uncultured Dialister sp.]|jgi:hypothetical protein|uniref:hypothetical protein n=1 Tax=uncultured Dialister sp. TaxID=278064 RepID=UPI00261A75BB|nr:hypothetical protein [uncultured Dialister sp.]